MKLKLFYLLNYISSYSNNQIDSSKKQIQIKIETNKKSLTNIFSITFMGFITTGVIVYIYFKKDKKNNPQPVKDQSLKQNQNNSQPVKDQSLKQNQNNSQPVKDLQIEKNENNSQFEENKNNSQLEEDQQYEEDEELNFNNFLKFIEEKIKSTNKEDCSKTNEFQKNLENFKKNKEIKTILNFLIKKFLEENKKLLEQTSSIKTEITEQELIYKINFEEQEKKRKEEIKNFIKEKKESSVEFNNFLKIIIYVHFNKIEIDFSETEDLKESFIFYLFLNQKF